MIPRKLEELFGMDLRALAFMRVGFSSMLLFTLLDELPHLKAFFTDDGVLPRADVIRLLSPGAVCLHLANGTYTFQLLLFLLLLALTVSLLVGYRTRLCTIAVWVLLCSLHNRNPIILGAEDKLVHILFFWFMFLPWGACYSLDRLREPQWRPPERVYSMASAGYLLQIAFFYCFAGFMKNAPVWTVDHTALHYVLSIDEFNKPLGRVLLSHQDLLKRLTVASLLLERFGPLLFFVPLKTTFFRLAGFVLFAAFHIFILLCMELRFFQWICLITLIGFLPTAFWHKALGPRPAPPELQNRTRGPLADLFKPPRWVNYVLGFLIFYIFLWNMGEQPRARIGVGPSLRWIGHTLDVNQHWGMFGPWPMTDDGWFVVPGKLRDGSTVDVLHEGRPVSWEEPASIPRFNKNYDWTLYYMNIHNRIYAPFVPSFGNYLCREWNGRQPSQRRAVSLDIIFVERDIRPPGQQPFVHQVPLLSVQCPQPLKRGARRTTNSPLGK